MEEDLITEPYGGTGDAAGRRAGELRPGVVRARPKAVG